MDCSHVSRRLLCALSLVCAATAWAADDEFERVLLPITSADTAGAFGARWTTELWFRNDSDTPTALFPVTIGDYRVPTNVTSPLPIYRPAPYLPPGQFVYVTRAVADHVRFSIRVRDASRADSSGAEIPVIRQSEFFRGRVVLINVPVVASSRAALRVYATSSAPHADVRLRIFDENSTEPIVDTPLELVGPEPQFYFPLYAQILSLGDAFPRLRSLERTRIEVSSDDPSVEIWAFVSLTSNGLNAITTVTPQ